MKASCVTAPDEILAAPYQHAWDSSAWVIKLSCLADWRLLCCMQVQRQTHISYQQHFSRIGTALALPAAAFVLHWFLLLLNRWFQGRDSRKLKALEAAQRSMVKELKVLSQPLNNGNSHTSERPCMSLQTELGYKSQCAIVQCRLMQWQLQDAIGQQRQ